MEENLDNHANAYVGDDNIYHFDNNILMHWYPKRILELCTNKNALLELGLGHGFTAQIFTKKFLHHVILDGSPAVIGHFTQKFPNFESTIIETYFETYETNERFDAVIMGFVLEHVNNPVELMSKFKKFLNPGGCIYVTVPNAEVLNRRLGVLGGLLDNIEELSLHDHALGHKRYYSVKSLSDDIEAAGLKIDVLEGIYLKPFTTKQMLSLQLSAPLIEALCKIGMDYPELSCGILAKLSIR